METEKLNQISNSIKHQLISDDSEIRSKYLEHFSDDVSKFTSTISTAFLRWETFDEIKGDEHRSHVSMLVFSAITLQVISMKLFLSGHIIPAGNIQRQGLEAIALALLCSGKNTGVLKKDMANEYHSHKVFTDIRKHEKQLNVNSGALDDLEKARKFYHSSSHPSQQLLAAYTSVSKPGCFYIGTSFDEGKLEYYKQEIAGRIGLSEILEGFIAIVNKNVSAW